MSIINANELLEGLSLALDVAENKTFEHAQRTAFIALKIAKELKLSEEELQDIFVASLLHDIGMTTSIADSHQDVSLVVAHCQVGAQMIASLPFPKKVSEYIRWHHANWDGSGPFECEGASIPVGSQIIFLADQLDVVFQEFGSIYNDRSEIRNKLNKRSGVHFNPQLVAAFFAVQSNEIFWLEYSSPYLSEILRAIRPTINLEIDSKYFEQIAKIFAKIIDNKSPFTYEHSQGVTSVAIRLGEHFKLDKETLQKLKISALLHDLGKLTIPNSILDKPGKLTLIEYQRIKSHPYYTKLILSRIKGLETIRDWAGNHHETLDGKGYPEGIREERLCLPERIIAVSDIYQALTEERPYRKPLPESQVMNIIQGMVKEHKLSSEVFANLSIVLK
ncbi:HD-GYP domain-containing protein [Desulfitobacterium sp. Sab5]|uniref:HD-GYP domain-containing protein n=1 Tax=Desulfitobacterium nosdiversum TaxID=3375356 RepID=UPI003CEAEB59